MSRGLRDSEVVPSDRGVVPSDVRQAVGVEGHSWSLGRPSAESFHPGECPHVDKHQAGQEMGPGQALPLLPACAYSCLPRPASGRAVDLRCQLALGLTLSWLPGFRPPGSALGGSWPHLIHTHTHTHTRHQLLMPARPACHLCPLTAVRSCRVSILTHPSLAGPSPFS